MNKKPSKMSTDIDDGIEDHKLCANCKHWHVAHSAFSGCVRGYFDSSNRWRNCPCIEYEVNESEKQIMREEIDELLDNYTQAITDTSGNAFHQEERIAEAKAAFLAWRDRSNKALLQDVREKLPNASPPDTRKLSDQLWPLYCEGYGDAVSETNQAIDDVEAKLCKLA